MKCLYCHCLLTHRTLYIVRKAFRPKSQPNRWKEIGQCCEACEVDGYPLQYEFGETCEFTVDPEVIKATLIRASKLKW